MENIELLITNLFQEKDSAIARDLKLNLKKYLLDGALTQQEALLITYSLASAFKQEALAAATQELLQKDSEYSDMQIQEAKEVVALMGMLNNYYKYKNYSCLLQADTPAGLRMNALVKHSLSNNDFELLALAHSLANACEYCIKAHEQVLIKQSTSLEKIHDTAKLTSILKGVAAL